jgi:hypothetical protein
MKPELGFIQLLCEINPKKKKKFGINPLLLGIFTTTFCVFSLINPKFVSLIPIYLILSLEDEVTSFAPLFERSL